jgi:hypothetical protein
MSGNRARRFKLTVVPITQACGRKRDYRNSNKPIRCVRIEPDVLDKGMLMSASDTAVMFMYCLFASFRGFLAGRQIWFVSRWRLDTLLRVQ